MPFQTIQTGVLVSLTRYREFSIEDECMWDPVDGQSFGEYYALAYLHGYEETEDGAWTVEYAWGGGGCDLCSGTPPDASDDCIGCKRNWFIIATTA